MLEIISEGTSASAIAVPNRVRAVSLELVYDRAQRRYVGSDGNYWTPVTRLSKESGIIKSTLVNLLHESSQVLHKGRTRKEITLYQEAEALKQIGWLRSLPRADKITGGFLHERIQVAPESVFLRRYGVNQKTFQALMGSIASVTGRDRTGRVTSFYSEEEVEKKISPLLENRKLPKVKEKGAGISEGQDERWLSIPSLCKKYKVDRTTLERRAAGVRVREARCRSGRKIVLLNESEVVVDLNDFLALPRIDKHTNRYFDGSRKWAVSTTLARENGIHQHTLLHFLEGVSILRGRDRIGQETNFYDEAEVINRLAPYNAIPQMGENTEEYLDDQGVSHVSIETLSSIMSRDYKTVANKLTNLGSITVRKNGRVVTLYCKEEALVILNASYRVSIPTEIGPAITSEEAEEEFRRIMGV